MELEYNCHNQKEYMYLGKEYSSKSVLSASHILDIDNYSMFSLVANKTILFGPGPV